MSILSGIKNNIKRFLIFTKIDLTKNIKYDRLTAKIIKKCVSKDSVCIDVGAHKGEILSLIQARAPKQKHYAFEPIPQYYQLLKNNFGESCEIYPFALSDKEGQSSFQFVTNAPAYSGIQKRSYKVKNPNILELQVDLKKLDDIIPLETKIDLIKIDVEGAEFSVLKGAKETIKRTKPTIIFECGLGASDFYGFTPEEFFTFVVNELNMNLFTLENFLENKQSINNQEFFKYYKNGSEYYFVIN